MRTPISLRCLLVALALAMSSQAGAQDPAAPADVVDAFHDALRAGDREAALALMSPEVLVYESGYIERDRATYAASHLAADIEFAAATRRQLVARQVYENADSAVVTTEHRVSGTFRQRQVDLTSLGTTVLTRGPDGWRIQHLHWSSRAGAPDSATSAPEP